MIQVGWQGFILPQSAVYIYNSADMTLLNFSETTWIDINWDDTV